MRTVSETGILGNARRERGRDLAVTLATIKYRARCEREDDGMRAGYPRKKWPIICVGRGSRYLYLFYLFPATALTRRKETEALVYQDGRI